MIGISVALGVGEFNWIILYAYLYKCGFAT